MGTNDPSEATTSCIDVAQDSESTVEIKIKTLDSQTYTLRVDKSVSASFLFMKFIAGYYISLFLFLNILFNFLLICLLILQLLLYFSYI